MYVVQCSGHSDTNARPPTPNRFQFYLEERWSMDVQTKHDISAMVEDGG